MQFSGATRFKYEIVRNLTLCGLKSIGLLSTPKVDPNVRLDGQVFIVTGGNRGIGKGAVDLLVKHGARVIIATFELEDAKKVASEHPQGKVDVQFLDLSSFKSVRSFAQHIIANEARIDCLINNAAVMEASYKQTEDGIERDKQINLVAATLLTCLLLPLLEKCKGRVVNIGSMGHQEIDTVEVDNSKWWTDEKNYDIKLTYDTTKLAILLVSRYLGKKLHDRGVKVYVVDPGMSPTNLASCLPGGGFWPFIFSIKGLTRPPSEAAVSHVLAAIDSGSEYIPGQKYYMYYGSFVNPSRIASDDSNAEAMWTHVSSLIGCEANAI